MKVAQIWHGVQANLFPYLERCLDVKLSAREQQLVAILEVARVEEHVPHNLSRRVGRPPKDRRPLARAFLAKAVYDVPQTKQLLEMLRAQPVLLSICGWRDVSELPDASTFSRAFAGFARTKLGDRVHQALVKEYASPHLVGHISRDSTAIEAREKPVKKPKQSQTPAAPKRGRGRPKKGEVVEPKPPTRLETQVAQDPLEAIRELPVVCDVGCKHDSKGKICYWVGYKTHLDISDSGLPITVVTTSASLYDNQVAIPMEKITASRVTSLYSLMDAAYDAKLIHACCRSLDHVPIIDCNSRGHKSRTNKWDPATAQRYKERTTVERTNSRLKDSFGCRHVRVRGHEKVHMHVMFGVIALFADQLLRLVS